MFAQNNKVTENEPQAVKYTFYILQVMSIVTLYLL